MKNGELKTKQSKEEIKALLELVGGDEGILLFLEEWLKNGRNAKRAYLKLHPNVTEQSAEVLGSRMLSKVKISDIFCAFGIGIETYMKQLKEGLNAVDKNGKPDHKTRRPYHQVVGEVFGIEGKKADIGVQINIVKFGKGWPEVQENEVL